MSGVSRELARYSAESRYDSLPAEVRHEGLRSFVNWLGCVLGGSSVPGVGKTLAVLDALSGPREASALGHGRRLDIFGAAFVNGMANSIRGYNDTHLRTVAHPAASVGAALLAMAERRPAPGTEFLHALILGIELQCRIGNILVTPPGRSHFGLSMVGAVGGIGAAVGVAKLLALDEQHSLWALGLAAGQAGGIRETHGTIASHLLSGEAARSGLLSALLAERGCNSSNEVLEGPKGFAQVYATDADPAVALSGLGTQYEILSNTYKPYPCGIVIHPIIDVCLDLVRAHGFAPQEVERVDLTVNPLAVQLTGRKEPPDGLRAGSSLYHWAAAALFHRAAGMAQGTDACVHDPGVVALRGRVVATEDPAVAADAARAAILLTDGRVLHGSVEHARGSAERPLSDDELSEKFLGQADLVMAPEAARALLDRLWRLEEADDVGACIQAFFPELPSPA